METLFERVVPVLRIFDVAKAREFYLDVLGLEIDWEHRHAEEFPLYIKVSRGDLALHLGEQHGDACPGSTVYVYMRGLTGLHAEISATGYAYSRPGLEEQPWGMREMTVTDPFGNRIRFGETI
ncbi:glyoxalase superfamily protein [Lutibaculum baratangense]|uniref:Bleomycin resistance protein n=1 Tax=Lutibaculum baratangense AMV1 TaxID=631454 RepID=V4R442_9HYPH|nr:glyoxalase superfamily protein [Lutibaculum baratangense]ESR26727.1 Glyoxalase family protein [Lutibaculum baratangense AMV1]